MNLTKSFFKFFPTPRFLRMDHVGVDVSSTAVRFIELKKTAVGGAITLGKFGQYPLSTPLPAESLVRSNKELMAILRKMRKENRLSFVEVSIPEEKAYLFTMEVPIGDVESIQNNIEFHLEENVPISLSDAVFDYRVIRENKRTQTLFIAVSVITQAVAEDYVGLFMDAGMTPLSLLIESQAIARAVVKMDDRSSYLVAHLGMTKTVISVVCDGTAQFTSTINIGSDDFTQAIMKEFNISKEDAEKMKREKGFSRSKDDQALFASLINTAASLRDEISRIYFYWQSSLDKMKVGEKAKGAGASAESMSKTPIQKIIVTGKDSSIVGFKDYLALSLKLKVDLGDVWTNVLSFEKSIPPIERNESLDYATVIGLSLPSRDI